MPTLHTITNKLKLNLVCVCVNVRVFSLHSGPVPHASVGSRTTMESRMSGPLMTSTSVNSVPTCAMDMAGVITDTAGQHLHKQHTHTHARVRLRLLFITLTLTLKPINNV